MENSTSQSKWYDKTWLVVLLCVFFFPVGLYALWKNSQISKGWKIGVTVIIGFLVILQFGSPKKSGSTSADTSSSTSSQQQTEQQIEAPKGVAVGEILKTDYFDITVNEVSLQESVNTGNEYASLKAEQGNMYLVINASFKNTDTESRMLSEGSVFINYNGKNYEFDKSESILAEGWGLFLEQLNPLTTKTTNLIYKIPSEIKGDAFWQPGRADSDQKILLGNLN